MKNPINLRIFLAHSAWAFLVLTGCEGIDRHHDKRVVDIEPPETDSGYVKASKEPMPAYADLVEDMEASRKVYLDNIMRLERGFLMGGDTTRANWARRQREMTAQVEVFPYLSDKAPEQRAQVEPIENIPAADDLYQRGMTLLDDFRKIPLAGTLKKNKIKAREALDLFKHLLSEFPTSDKVDDAAFWCGEIYKEYLREDDPDDELSVRYYTWAFKLDPQTPHPARFSAAVVYDFRMHDRAKAIELYNQVLETEEANNQSNQRFSATRIEQLADDDHSHLRPQMAKATNEPTDSEAEPRVNQTDSSDREAHSTRTTPSTTKAPRSVRANEPTSDNPSVKTRTPARVTRSEPKPSSSDDSTDGNEGDE